MAVVMGTGGGARREEGVLHTCLPAWLPSQQLYRRQNNMP